MLAISLALNIIFLTLALAFSYCKRDKIAAKLEALYPGETVRELQRS